MLRITLIVAVLALAAGCGSGSGTPTSGTPASSQVSQAPTVSSVDASLPTPKSPPVTTVSSASAATTSPRAGDQPSTLDDLYARLDAAMRKPGQVLHTTIDLSATPSDGSVPITIHEEIWADLPANVARQEVTEVREPASQSVTLIIMQDQQYAVGGTGSTPVEAQTCHGSNSAVVSLLLGCEGSNTDSQTTVDPQAEYDGKPTFATISVEGPGASDQFTSRLFFDSETWLPFALSADTHSSGITVQTKASFRSEFVDRQSLSVGFFDAKSPETSP